MYIYSIIQIQSNEQCYERCTNTQASLLYISMYWSATKGVTVAHMRVLQFCIKKYFISPLNSAITGTCVHCTMYLYVYAVCVQAVLAYMGN